MLQDRQGDGIDVVRQSERDIVRQIARFLEVLGERPTHPPRRVMRQRAKNLLGKPAFRRSEAACFEFLGQRRRQIGA